MADLQWGEQFYRNYMGTTSAYTGFYNGQPVVLKHHRFLTSKDLSRACERAEAQNRLVHEGIVRLICHFSLTEKQEYGLTVVLERMKTDLGSEMSSRKSWRYGWDERELWGYVWTLVHALAYAQEQQVCHRNIQPDNLFLSSADTMKISNFNKAKVSDVTVTVQSTEIPYYASPELKASLMSHSEVPDFNPYQSDVYSLGLVLLQMVLLSPSPELGIREELETATNDLITGLPVSDCLKSLLGEMLRVQRRMDFLQLRTYVTGLFASAEPAVLLVEPQDESTTLDGDLDPTILKWMLNDTDDLQSVLELTFKRNIDLHFTCTIELTCAICEKHFTVDSGNARNEESYLVCGEKCREAAIQQEKTFNQAHGQSARVKQQLSPKVRKVPLVRPKLRVRFPLRTQPARFRIPPSRNAPRKSQ